MKQIFLLLVVVTTAINSFGQNFGWAKSTGGTNDDVCYSTASDLAGNVYSTGFFSGIVDFDPGGGIYNLSGPFAYTLFIQKLDSAGNFVWAKQISSTSGYVIGESISTDQVGNLYLTGRFGGTADFDPGISAFNLTCSGVGPQDVFVEKLDSAGNFIWAKQMNGNGHQSGGQSIKVNNIGDVFITGYFSGTVDFDPGIGTSYLTSGSSTNYDVDIFIQKLNSSGNLLWVKHMGPGYYCHSYSIAFDASGNIYTIGRFNGTVDFDPGSANTNTATITPGGTDIFIQKLDALGNFIWVKHMGSQTITNYDAGLSITVDNGGNIITAGTFSGTVDFDPNNGIHNLTSVGLFDGFVEKLDGSGNFIWVEKIGGTGTNGNSSTVYSVSLDSSGNIYSIGYFDGLSDFDPNSGVYNLSAANGKLFIQKIDNSGNFVWARQFGGTGGDPRSLMVQKDNSIRIAGSFQYSADFDPSSNILNLTSQGSSDFFVEKLNPGISSLIKLSNAATNNPAFLEKTIWAGNTNQSANPIKICADGSQATHISFINKTGIASGKIRFWIESDTAGVDSYTSGYFINYAIHTAATGDTITAELAHPKYLAVTAGLFRPDNIRIVDSSNSYPNIYIIPIQIYRTPVLMVHGLWADPTTFTSFESTLDGSGKYPAILTFSADYVQSNDRSLAENYSIVSNEVNTLFSYCRNHGFSAGKVDIIGHSMGGLLSRQYIQSPGYRNDVRKLITLNTPHAGSQAANLLRNPLFVLIDKVLNHVGKNVDNGAISDLRGAGVGLTMQNLNNGSNQNFSYYPNIAIHAVTTASTIFSDLTWGALFIGQVKLATAFATADLAVNSLYQGEGNDLVVPLSSQQGGLVGTTTSFVSGQWHSSCDNTTVQTELKKLLDARPDSALFDHSGFHPPVLTSAYKMGGQDTINTKQTGTGKVTINTPAANTTVLPGQQIMIGVSSTGTINHLTAIESNEVAGLSFKDTALGNAGFAYTIPQNAVGNISIVAVGADANGLVDYDTLSLSVSITAALDSLHFYPEEIAIPLRNNFAVNLTGYFHDGGVRILNFVSGIQYQIADTTIARYAGKNLIYGKQVGTTSLRISYLGDTVQIPISVFPGDPNFPPTSISQQLGNAGKSFNALTIYPNPNQGSFTIQFPTLIGELVGVEIIDQLGQKVFATSEKSSSKIFQKQVKTTDLPPGVYFVHVSNSVGDFGGKMIIVK